MQEGAAWPKENAAVTCESFEQETSITRPERVTPLASISSGLYLPAAKPVSTGVYRCGWCQYQQKMEP